VTGDFAVNTNKFNVTATSGNTAVAGTLGVTGATTVSSTLGVTGATTLSSTLALTGNATFGGTITGPASAAFTIDSGGANVINLGGANATTLNLGRSAQTQALLGNATVAGTLTSTGQINANGNLRIGATGTPILLHLSQTYALNFASLGQNSCVDSAASTLTGAALGDTVEVNVNAAWQANLSLSAYVSAANTVKVRWCNVDQAGSPDPDGAGGATYRVDVWRH
jgi:hypothetical protein